MQTCTNCHHQSPDNEANCVNCQKPLAEFSETAVALKRIQNNPRIKNVILANAGDACPACREVQGTYYKENAPALPVEGCSHALGCRCFYEPVLEEIYP